MLLWSGVDGQLFSLCRCGQALVVSYCHIMLLWSGVGGQVLSHHVTVVRGWWLNYFHHITVVRGWWSTILIMSLWSGVDGQLLGVDGQLFSSCRCGQGLVVSYCHIMFLWSGVVVMLVVNCAPVL